MEKIIGKYKIVREIGKGGMGIVYKGLDPQTQKSVAVKVLPAANVDRSTVERFSREAAAMAKVKHLNLVEVFEHGMTGGEHYFVMEYIEGESLKNMIKHKGKLAVSECLEITSQIADALNTIHAEGMIHRDVKPGNIMIAVNGRIKLMDFGLVQIPGLTRVTVEGSAVGTAEYMSPEQISDEGVDTRTDIYSLGVTVYEMLTGQPPFQGETLQAVLMKQKYEAPPALKALRPEVPDELARIVTKAMSKDLGQRYQRMQELIADISKLKENNARPTADAPEPTVTAAAAGPVAASPSVPPPQPVAASRPAFVSDKSWMPFVVGVLLVALAGYGGHTYRSQITSAVARMLKKKPAQKNAHSKKSSSRDDSSILILEQLEQADGHYIRGADAFRSGDLDTAINEYQQAIELRDDHALFYKDLALAWEKKGDKSQAIAVWQKLLRRIPSTSLAPLARQRIEALSK